MVVSKNLHVPQRISVTILLKTQIKKLYVHVYNRDHLLLSQIGFFSLCVFKSST